MSLQLFVRLQGTAQIPLHSGSNSARAGLNSNSARAGLNSNSARAGLNSNSFPFTKCLRIFMRSKSYFPKQKKCKFFWQLGRICFRHRQINRAFSVAGFREGSLCTKTNSGLLNLFLHCRFLSQLFTEQRNKVICELINLATEINHFCFSIKFETNLGFVSPCIIIHSNKLTNQMYQSLRFIARRLTLRRLMSYIYIYIYIYMEHPFLMFLDHTQRRSTVGRTPLDE